MAIIYSYPYIAPKPKDLMIGTSVVEPFDSNSNEDESTTVSWQLQDIINMIATSTGQQTLQQVTSLGDSTTNPVILSNYLSLGGAVLDKTGSAGASGEILSSTVAGTAWVANTGQGVTSVTGSTPIVSSGGLTPAISLAASGVSTGTYANPTITVDTYGRITVASGSSAPVSSFSSTFNTTGFISGTTNALATGAVNIGTVDLNATGLGATPADRAVQFLRGDNSWAPQAAGYVNWKASGDNQTPAAPITVTNGFDLKFTGYIDPVTTGGAGIVTDSAISTNEMTVALAYTGGTPSATTFYRGDGQWAIPSSSSGGVTGSGTQYQLPIWDTVAGTNLGNSKVYQKDLGTVNDDTVFLGTSSNYLKVTKGQNAFDCLQSSSNLTLRAGGPQLSRSQIYLGNSTGSYFYGGAASTSGNYGGGGYGLFMQPGDGDFLVRGNTTENYLRVKGITDAAPGEIVIAKYGSGNNTGTAAYNLSVDSTGKIIETANGGGTDIVEEVVVDAGVASLAKTITIPSGATSIQENGFSSEGLTAIVLPAGLITINEKSFEDNKIKSVAIPSTVAGIIGEKAFEKNNIVGSIVIPSGVTEIKNSCFGNQINQATAGITSLTFTAPSSLTTIGSSAFQYHRLTTVTFPNTLTSIGSGAFGYRYVPTLTSIVFSSTAITIGSGAFSNAFTGTTLTIPNNSNIQGFDNSSNLTTLNLGTGITLGESVFTQCTSLVTVTLPTGTVLTGGTHFYQCTSLTTINIPTSITVIPSSFVSNCTAFTGGTNLLTSFAVGSATFASQITQFKNSCFASCTSLATTLNFPTVCTIDENAFANSSVTTANIKTGSTIDADAFDVGVTINLV